MSQLAQLSEAEIEDRFHIRSRTAIQFLLANFARQGTPFAVQFRGGQEYFYSILLAVQPDSGRLVFDCSGSPENNRRFLDSERNAFLGQPGGMRVQFSTGRAREVNFQGAKAFAVPLPQVLLRLQRREYFRIETPQVRPLEFLAGLPGGASLNLPVHDISVSGIGLAAAALPDGAGPGLSLEGCRFALPEEGRALFFAATLRHCTEREARNGCRQWRLGLQFSNLPATDANRIQRYIARVEHERRELS
ncbi:MAG: YcgR [Proteobacteria bacterium]|nr:YcgR [Pseudomonadota bacterium]